MERKKKIFRIGVVILYICILCMYVFQFKYMYDNYPYEPFNITEVKIIDGKPVIYHEFNCTLHSTPQFLWLNTPKECNFIFKDVPNTYYVVKKLEKYNHTFNKAIFILIIFTTIMVVDDWKGCLKYLTKH